MPVQLQVHQAIHCSGHRWTRGLNQQEEARQVVHLIQGVEALVNGVIKEVIHPEEALDQEEAMDQEEQDLHRHRHPLHQEEGVQEEDQEQIRCREELRPSKQEEEQEIPSLRRLYLRALHSLHAHQIHGVHLIDPGKPYRGSCYRPTIRHAAYWKWGSC